LTEFGSDPGHILESGLHMPVVRLLHEQRRLCRV